MSFITNLELSIIEHKDVITLLFTLILIIFGICTTYISFKSIEELKKNREYQLWIFLKKTLINLKNTLCDYKTQTKDTKDTKKLVLDESSKDIELIIENIEKKLDNHKKKHKSDLYF